jgi:methylene-fatty-acyl-phospholipid synthase
MKAQPTLPALDTPLNGYVSLALIVVGMQFVFTSFWALGFNGTFLGAPRQAIRYFSCFPAHFARAAGDYCGILMTARVTGYPYTLLDNPMYVGSTMAFLGRALGFDRANFLYNFFVGVFFFHRLIS